MAESDEMRIDGDGGSALVPHEGRGARLRPIRGSHRLAPGRAERAARTLMVAQPVRRVERRAGWSAGGILKGTVLGAFAVAAVAGALVMVLLLITVWNFFAVTGRATASIGDRLNEAVTRTEQAVSTVAQEVADARDPAHPPRAELAQDVEFDSITRIALNGELPASRDHRLTLSDVRRRPDASNPDQAQYAVVHREFRQPRETKLLGQTILVDRDEKDYYLYKGQTVRIGRDLYKVNWVSLATGQIGLARYRQPDTFFGRLEFELD
jgi:hypothetical protein